MSETVAPARRGLTARPVVGKIDGKAILGDIDGSPYVRLRDLSPRIGWTDTGQRYAIRTGLLEAEKVHNAPGQPYRVTRDEARLLLFAALLALAAGVAVAVMLRGLKGSGVTGAAAAAAIRNMTS